MGISSKTASMAAKRGFEYEKKFVKLVNTSLKFNESLKNILKIRGEVKAELIESNKPKADVRLFINKKKEIRVSIKTAKSNFNQLDRRWLKDLAEKHKMPKNIQDKLNECLAHKSRNRRGKFILEKYEKNILNFFKANMKNILKDVFTRDDDKLKYMVVCNYASNEWHISSIGSIIEEIIKSDISVTKQGVIKIGNYLTIQRKGGNGVHIKIPKTDPRHPSNQMQLKLKPISLLMLKSFKKVNF